MLWSRKAQPCSGSNRGGQQPLLEILSEDCGLLLPQLQDRLVSMWGSSVGDDLKWPPLATGICEVEFSIAGFAGEEEEKERRKKEGPVGPPVHFCLRSQPSISWGYV